MPIVIMSELRQRPVPRDSKAESTSVPKAKRRDKDSEGGISLLDVIRVIVTLVVGSCALSYFVTSSESFLWGYRPWFTRWPVVLSYLVSLQFVSFFYECFSPTVLHIAYPREPIMSL